VIVKSKLHEVIIVVHLKALVTINLEVTAK